MTGFIINQSPFLLIETQNCRYLFLGNEASKISQVLGNLWNIPLVKISVLVCGVMDSHVLANIEFFAGSHQWIPIVFDYCKTPNFCEHLIFSREQVKGGSGSSLATSNIHNLLGKKKMLKVTGSLTPALCENISKTSGEIRKFLKFRKLRLAKIKCFSVSPWKTSS